MAALRATTAEAAAAEYDALFHGVGKPEVFPYGSYHLSRLPERAAAGRAAQRPGRARPGARRARAWRPKTTSPIVFEVMRYLIAGDDVAVCNLEQQRRFFRAHLQPWVEQRCATRWSSTRGGSVRALAGFTRAFVQVETQGFDLLE